MSKYKIQQKIMKKYNKRYKNEDEPAVLHVVRLTSSQELSTPAQYIRHPSDRSRPGSLHP